MAPEETVIFFYEGEAYRVPLDVVHRHPDGEALILPFAGKDLTDAFHNAGHTGTAGRLLRRFKVKALTSFADASANRYKANRKVHTGKFKASIVQDGSSSSDGGTVGNQAVLWSRAMAVIALATTTLATAVAYCRAAEH